ncbi:hypothetical protein [Anaerosporobacter faecicola]|uniref:hypothetical protein n=1 Tax=Anaerosporobacter faecicola TaxID=2718714 RepID=UPI00143A636B|nr:hypothetical protein [Anaerosporobacter faecicola]
MKKRFLFCVLVLLFLLCAVGCKKKESKQGFQPPMKGFTWGMSCKDALALIGEGKYDKLDLEDGLHVAIILKENVKLFDAQAQPYLLFSKELCKDAEDGGRLQAVILRYMDISEEQLFTNMTEEMGDATRDSAPVEEVKNYIWDSKTTLADLSKKDYKCIADFMSNEEQAKKLVEPDRGVALEVPTEEQPVNAVALKKVTTDGTVNLSVVYYGDWLYLLKVLQEEQ